MARQFFEMLVEPIKAGLSPVNLDSNFLQVAVVTIFIFGVITWVSRLIYK